jgi:hypothetical protein
VPFSASTAFSIAALSASEGDYLEISAPNSSSTPSTHFSNGLASDKATELGDEATVAADGEGPVASDDGNHIRSSKQVRRIRARKRKGRR